ncbi:MAG: LytTR family DNA-binding domain-containing protein [Dysgonamonadaceae bacterium]
MEHPVFQNKISFSLYVAFWTIVSAAMSITVRTLSPESLTMCLIWGSLAGYSFGGLSLPLWRILKYADYSSQRRWHAMLNYVALGVLMVGVWIGMNYLLFSVVDNVGYLSLTTRLIPLQFFIGSCFFCITILVYNQWLEQNEAETPLADIIQPDEADVVVETDDEPLEIIERIAIKTKQKIEVVMVPDIIFIQSEGDYTMIHTASGRFLKEQTMKYFETHLPSDQFVRIHRSYIVNVLTISKIELFEKQTHLVILKNGMKVKASLAGYKLLKNVLNLT